MLFYLLLGAVCAVVVVVVVLLKSLPALRPIDVAQCAFVDPRTNKRHQFPSLFADAPELYLSLIVPMYNEESRLAAMMAETMPYLERRHAAEPTRFTYEVILVDDGSRDRTTEVALEFSHRYGTETVRVLTLETNRGKGGAVRTGMHVARGQFLLMVDADGATRFEDLENLEREIARVSRDGLGIAVGSRAHLQDAAVAERTLLRNILMHGFHFLVSTLCVSGIRDTQCGFKLFSRLAAQTVFPPLHLERWAFDVEVLYLAQRGGIPVAEVAVNWEEIPGSKLDVVIASLQMARDLVRIRLAYMTGVWRAGVVRV